MNKMIQTLVGRLKKPDEDETALKRLMPLIVPARYFTEGRFPAPSEILPCGDFALTAVILGKTQTMVYVTKPQAEAWAAAGISWQTKAKQNLRQDNRGDPFTHSKYSDDKRLLFAMMMNPDGLGTSRVYCSDALRRVFPKGYWIAIPERSVGCAISKGVTKAEKLEAVEMIEECFRVGTTPNSPRLFEPEELGA